MNAKCRKPSRASVWAGRHREGKGGPGEGGSRRGRAGRQGLRVLTWETRDSKLVHYRVLFREVKDRHWHFLAQYLAVRPNITTLKLRAPGLLT